MPETLVVNFFAGPGAGKTTCAWEVAAELKKRNIVTEYVSEYAKELVWDNRRDLLDGSYDKQRLVLEEQARRVERLIGKVDVVVTDSPVLLQPAYCKENQAEFEREAFEIFSSRNNFNLFINRGNHYEQAGRIHTLDESRKVDAEVKEILSRHNIYYGTYSHSTIDVVVENIQKTLNRLNTENERGDSMPKYDKEAYAEQMKIRTAELTDKLQTGMSELYNSDKYRDYLKAMSQFHNYSARNIMLIHTQMPNASRIASFAVWKEKFTRSPKKDEKALYIYAPAKQKEPEKVLMEKLDPATGEPLFDKNNQPVMEEMTPLSALHPKFVLVPVFDVSQTVGEPLPELVENITGNVAHYEAFIDALRDVSPLPIGFEPMSANQDGYCEFGVKIGIREGMSETQTVSAVVHEIVHDRLHDKNNLPENTKPKNVRIQEIEAESISYVVCQHYGIETSPNSFGYLAEHGSQAELNASIDIIRKESNNLITAIDGRFSVICQERGIDRTATEPEQAATPPVQAEPSYTTESRTENIAGVDFEFQSVVPPLTAELENQYAAANLETARTDVLKTLDTLFFTQRDRNSVVALLNENATNSDISLYLSNTHSGKSIIKAEPDYSLSVETTSEGIENTLINRLIAWEDVAPVVRSLGMQWKAEHDLSKYSHFQHRGFEIAKKHEHLPLQDRLNIIAETFGCKTASMTTRPCTGKWRGTSDISIVLDNGASLFVGNYRTPEAKKNATINECVNNALANYNPEIVSEAKARATAALSKREAEDNAVAEQKGLKPYTFLNVELNEGDDGSGYVGWYYVTLAVDGKPFTFVETGLNHDIARGVLADNISRPNYFIAGGLRDNEVDFVFNNVGHSSFNGSHHVHFSEEARERAEIRLKERLANTPEREQNNISFYTLNIDSNSVPTFYDNHTDAVEAYISVPSIDGRVLGFCGDGIDFYTFARRDGGIERIMRDNFPLSADDGRYPDLMDSLREVERKLTAAALEESFTDSDRAENNPISAQEQGDPDIIMPDPSIGVSEMNLYGYTADDMLPLTRERAIELFNADLTVYILFPDNTEMLVFETDDIHSYGTDNIFGITQADWEMSPFYADISERSTEPLRDTPLNALAQDIDNFLHDYDQESYLSSGMTFDQSLVMVESAIKDGGEYVTNIRDYLQEAVGNGQHSDRATDLLKRLNDISPPEQLQAVPAAVGGDIAMKSRAGGETQDMSQGEAIDIPIKEVPIYKYSVETAVQNGELDAFRESYKLNVDCGKAIDKAITDCNYEMYRYDLKTAAKSVIEEFGVDRVAWVVAANVNGSFNDGRFSHSNKEWAKEFDTPKPDIYLQTHKTVLDGFVDRFREAAREKPSLLDMLDKTDKAIKQEARQNPEHGKDKPKKNNNVEVE